MHNRAVFQDLVFIVHLVLAYPSAVLLATIAQEMSITIISPVQSIHSIQCWVALLLRLHVSIVLASLWPAQSASLHVASVCLGSTMLIMVDLAQIMLEHVILAHLEHLP